MSHLVIERRPKLSTAEYGGTTYPLIREVGSSFTVDGPATITIVEIRSGSIVRVSIEAPITTRIVRDDIVKQHKDLQT